LGVALDPACFIRYAFSSPVGDIEMEESDLHRPFLIAPGKPHPTLTLRDYFHTLERFLLDRNGKRLSEALRLHRSAESTREIKEIRIRSEKHGTFYHIACIEIAVRDRTLKFAAGTAVTDIGMQCLCREREVLERLGSMRGRAYLPRIAASAEAPFGDSTAMVMLSEWFEDYHEWHLDEDERTGNQRILLWDGTTGDRYLSRAEASQVYRQCACILTHYFDFSDFSQIHPWRHASGDFVVRAREGDIDVRLTTARDYLPVMDFGKGDRAVYTALVYFFLALSVNMRLDRRNGVDDMLWADEALLPAIIDGFFEALRAKSEACVPALGSLESLHSLIGSFSAEDLHRLVESLLVPYFEEDPEALEAIRNRLEAHAHELYAAVQAYRA